MAIITISRGTFSGGKAVAESLSEKLGYPCISKEIILDAAEEFGVPEEKLVAALEEPPKSLTLKPSRRAAHLNYVRYALLKAIKDGNLVFHGMIGYLLIRGISQILRVRIIEDIESRIVAAMEEQSLTRPQAESIIKKQDRQFSNWTNFLWEVDGESPSLYDVVINLECLCIESAVEIIKKMTTLSEFKTTEESREALNDELLSSLVWAALTKDKRCSSQNIRIVSSKGDVTISGNVDSERTIDAIQEVVMRVDGVKKVNNEVGIGEDWPW